MNGAQPPYFSKKEVECERWSSWNDDVGRIRSGRTWFEPAPPDDEQPLLGSEPEPSEPDEPPSRLGVGVAAVLTAVLCMSTYVVLGGRQVEGHDPAGFLLLRQLIAAACLIVGASFKHRGFESPLSEHTLNIQILGFFQFLNGICFVFGLAATGPFVAAVCQLTIPCLAMTHSVCTGLELPTRSRLLAVLGIVAGAALVVFDHTRQELASGGMVEQQQPGGDSAKAASIAPARDATHVEAREAMGAALLLVQCSSFVGIVIVQKKVLRDHTASMVVTRSYMIGTCWTLLYCLVDGSLFRLSAQVKSVADAGSLILAAVFGAAVYFEALAIATKHLPSTIVACSVALEPLAIAVFSHLAFGKEISWVEFGGYSLAATGVCFSAWQEGKSEKAPAPRNGNRSDNR